MSRTTPIHSLSVMLPELNRNPVGGLGFEWRGGNSGLTQSYPIWVSQEWPRCRPMMISGTISTEEYSVWPGSKQKVP